MSDRSLLGRGLFVVGQSIRSQPRPFAFGVSGALLYGAMTVVSSVVLGRVTDRVILPAFDRGDVATGSLVGAVAAILGVSLLKAIGIVGRRLGAYTMQYRLQAQYRTRVTDQLLQLPIAWHRRHPTGELLSNVSSDVESAFWIAAPLPLSIGATLMLVVTAVMLVVTDPFLAIVGFVIGPAMAVANWYYQHRMRAAAAAAQEERANVSQVAHESVDAALVVKTMGRERQETDRFRQRTEVLRDRMIEVGRLRAAFDPIIEALPNVGILLVLLVGAWRVDGGYLSAGDLVQFAYLFRLVAVPARVFGWMLSDLPRAVVGWDRISRVIDAEGHMAYGAASAAGDGGASVAADEVAFQHPVSTHDEAEHHETRGVRAVTFHVPAGRTIAVVGPTGSGKSTVAALLVRLFDPDGGIVVYDGRDLRDLDRDELAGHVAMVFQETFLFDDTVRENITLGEDFTEQEVEAAARLAQAHDFVAALPEGYDTQVGERGAQLSGGQRQRIALARALIRKPRLLVMDDATSSVDPAVEAAILRGLGESDLPSTVIVIAYRQGSIALADEVVFVEEGTIIARGSHAELMETTPAYKRLVTAYDQAQGEAA